MNTERSTWQDLSSSAAFSRGGLCAGGQLAAPGQTWLAACSDGRGRVRQCSAQARSAEPAETI